MITDTADHLVVNGVVIPSITPGTDVSITGTATIAQLAAIDAANGSGTLTYTSITDTTTNLAASVGTYVVAGKTVVSSVGGTVADTTAVKSALGGSDRHPGG
jgi:pectin methylesterase-like acyl-CoA thioesterase